jgi:hypothetical protein
VSVVRLVGRIFVSLLLVAAIAAAVHGGGPAIRWVLSSQGFGLLSREPMQPVQLSSLNRYTARVAARPWFRSYFTTMVFDQQRDQTISPSALVTKWERPRVSIRLLNSDGPEVAAYLDRLVARLDRLQHQVRFVVGGAGRPLITVQFLTHDAYVRAEGADSVGNTRTRYYTTSPGLIRARIAIDVGTQSTPDEVESTLIHELTHAIGCSGHFYSPSYRRRSVMYEANTLTTWSQNDAAVIRLLYSPWIRPGMSPSRAQASLQLYARSAK